MEERHSDMVSEIQGECVLSETVLVSLCEQSDTIQNTIEPKSVDEPIE